MRLIVIALLLILIGHEVWSASGSTSLPSKSALSSAFINSNAQSSNFTGSVPVILFDSSSFGEGAFGSNDRTGATGDSGAADFMSGALTNVATTGSTGYLNIVTGRNFGTGFSTGSEVSGEIIEESGRTASGDSGSLNLGSGIATLGDSGAIFLISGTAGHTSGEIGLFSGNGTTASGPIILGVGTGATKGKIKFQTGTNPAVGQVWTATATDGSGAWAGPPQGTVCGYYDTVGVALISSCLGSDPNVSCPTGYTAKSATGVKFCAAN